MAQAGKRADRATTEGLVGTIVDGTVGSIVGVGCETEPVSKNDEFQAFAEQRAACRPRRTAPTRSRRSTRSGSS